MPRRKTLDPSLLPPTLTPSPVPPTFLPCMTAMHAREVLLIEPPALLKAAAVPSPLISRSAQQPRALVLGILRGQGGGLLGFQIYSLLSPMELAPGMRPWLAPSEDLGLSSPHVCPGLPELTGTAMQECRCQAWAPW